MISGWFELTSKIRNRFELTYVSKRATRIYFL